ncbi:MAG: diacylglycerol kinase family protein [Bacteroidota bacterium]
MKLLFVVNPISGGVNKEPFIKKAQLLCNKYGVEYHIFKTSGKDDEKRLKDELFSYKPDKVVSVGGDGTTLFTSIALLNSSIPIGIIPLGSANGMATELFVNPDPDEALKDIIMSDVIGALDMVMVNEEHYSIHIGDVGVNARIVEAYENDSNRGMVTYAKYFLEELKTIKPFKITIQTDEQAISTKGVMLGICNSRKYGTGVPLNVQGNPMDGKFEIVVVEKINTSTLLKAGLSKFDDSFHDSQNGIVISTEKAEIVFDRPRLLQLDGEIIGEFERLQIEILKGAVRLITHNENLYL